MSIDIESIKRKLLIKYPTFGSIIANLEFQYSNDIETAGTNGKVIFYNPKYLEGLLEKQQMFIFAHEICHVAFEHIYRSEGKVNMVWNIATDAVINALLKQDGLPIVKGAIDIPDAINYDAEEMYNKLLEEKIEKGENFLNQNEKNGIGNDSHSLWTKEIEERKKEQQEQGETKNESIDKEEQGEQGQAKNESIDKEEQGEKSKEGGQEEQGQTKNESIDKKEQEQKEKRKVEKKSKFVEQGERKTFKENKIERKKQLQELSRELAIESSHEAGDEIQREGKRLYDIGIAAPLIDWRKLLRQAIKYDEEYTRKNARMRNGYFKYKLEQIPNPETEIVLDTSGSVSEILLKNFLRECKNILNNSKVKVGCFNTEFHGFTELKRTEDIDNMSFPIGGGTDFNVAVEAFSRNAPNKIIFTDGKAEMPQKTVRNVIWVVFGNEKINPKGGKVININGEQLKKLYQPCIKDLDNRSR